MDNIKNDSYYIKRIIRNVEILKRYIYEKSLDDLLNDGFLCDAIENRFTKIAEDSCNLSEKYLKENPSEAWKSLPGIRNRICHDYDSVDATTLYKTIKLDFVDFEQKLLNSIRCSTMNLYPVPFKLVKGRTKTVELRLNDEKRRSLKIGDLILFNDTETKNRLLLK